MAVSSMYNNPLYKYTLFQMKRRPTYATNNTTPFMTAAAFLDLPRRAGDASMATIQYPTRSCMWIRGSPVCIQWSVLDTSVTQVRIELCQWGSTAVTVLATHAPNSGCFVYTKVPWGVIGHNFYLRISDSDDTSNARYVASEYFSIGNPRQGW
ncbi:hypothetical protein ACHHYP_03093 [Achlya hypogyna]|uniref:Yeast cell wall synthesis Kre9/Knh1-like N-terminal domain-containing protein n=1 Tax=Achlya hypogyna TaxID=1202772 RepID=A0A1V9Z4U9_ACHHY|nr:hypothetical protein ACHHYP_03093 [Achlya hypogyna]